MKKAYINPATEIVNIEMAQMIAASVIMEAKDANSEAMSRGGSFWDNNSHNSLWDDDEE